MRKYLIILLSSAGLMGIFYWYSVYNAEQDKLDVALREINFLRIKPASMLDTLGALYVIDWLDLSINHVICSPPKEIVAKYVHHSKSAAMNWVFA
jgi:hypothetical protein